MQHAYVLVAGHAAMRNEVASPAMVVSERKGEITRRGSGQVSLCDARLRLSLKVHKGKTDVTARCLLRPLQIPVPPPPPPMPTPSSTLPPVIAAHSRALWSAPCRQRSRSSLPSPPKASADCPRVGTSTRWPSFY